MTFRVRTGRSLATATLVAVVAVVAVSCIEPPPPITSTTTTASTTLPPPAPGATAVATGRHHTCALMSEGSVSCWGHDYGDMVTEWDPHDQNEPVTISGVTGASALSAGDFETCAIVAGGAVRCWAGLHESSPAADVLGVSGATAISVGSAHACALVAGGAVKCWGRNWYGQLGNGVSTDPEADDDWDPAVDHAVDVIGVSGATAITAGGKHSCAVVAGGAVTCWGENAFGQLGDGTFTDSAVAVDVVGVSGATVLAAGGYDEGHTCAVVSGGAVTCWGANQWGQLGDGTNVTRSTAVDVAGLAGVTATGASSYHTCARLDGGTLRCWGINGVNGLLGDGTTTNSNTPVGVIGIADAVTVDAAGNHACAVVAGGGIKCWGANVHGQLGDGTFTASRIPVDVVGIP